MERSCLRYKDTPKYITKLARENRNNPTDQEEKLWSLISGKKLNGLKFRQQFPIGRYIVDFYNHANRIVIEIDGSIHDSTKEYDANRDDYLHAGGYKVLRFTNSEIESDIETVVQRILENTKNPPAGEIGGVR
jgi:very-short-patch-repair endonuclease